MTPLEQCIAYRESRGPGYLDTCLAPRIFESMDMIRRLFYDLPGVMQIALALLIAVCIQAFILHALAYAGLKQARELIDYLSNDSSV